MLSEEGLEILEIGIDESISLNENMVNRSGRKFLAQHYDTYLRDTKYGEESSERLEELYYQL
ncbi:hypothetical protein [Niameybacter sp.]|uniref:hypothetical protein n=1 Tax=Niameybacter sp. TaxID=2033640 RepID=UPI002FC65842